MLTAVIDFLMVMSNALKGWQGFLILMVLEETINQLEEELLLLRLVEIVEMVVGRHVY